jgi:hypothetical protein
LLPRESIPMRQRHDPPPSPQLHISVTSMCQLRGLGGGRPDPLPLWISFSARPSPYLGAPFSRGLPHQSCVKASCGGGGGQGRIKWLRRREEKVQWWREEKELPRVKTGRRGRRSRASARQGWRSSGPSSPSPPLPPTVGPLSSTPSSIDRAHPS